MIDSNGSRYHLLMGAADWSRCRDGSGRTLGEQWLEVVTSPVGPAPKVAWDPDRAELTLQPHVFQFVASAADRPPSLDDRRGAAQDRFGNIYWIDDSRRAIEVLSSGSGTESRFWPVPPAPAANRPGEFRREEAPPAPVAMKLAGLAVTEDHWLVVGVVEPAGVLLFDLYSVGAPMQILWPAGIPFEPFDMAPRPGGSVWILDRANRRYWALDRRFQAIYLNDPVPVIPPHEDFRPEGAPPPSDSPSVREPLLVSLEASVALPIDEPVAIEALPDGTVLLLETRAGLDFSRVHRYRGAAPVGRPASTGSMRQLVDDSEFRLQGQDFAFVPDRLYVVSADGNQTFLFRVALAGEDLVLEPRPAYLPMRLYTGRGLVNGARGLSYDSNARWIPLMEQRRPLFEDEGEVVTFVLDGKQPDCVWHRLLIDGSIPPETRVEVSSCANNDARLVERPDWLPEPLPYRRGNGSELAFSTGDPCRDTYELLFQRARGRYLAIKLNLAGDGRTTPRLRAVRIWYPRFSYSQRYLPAVYREDAESASFLERFLANAEGALTGIEDRIAAVQALFDVAGAPSETLDWLATWYGVALDGQWEEARRRLFLKYAMTFFQYRGTVRGLRMALHLALAPVGCLNEGVFTGSVTGDAVGARIVEKFRGHRLTVWRPGGALSTGVQVSDRKKRWTPDDGAAELHARWQAAGASGSYPISRPSSGAAEWEAFSMAEVGFIPSATADDTERWRDFLARRYQRIAALNTAHGANWASFGVVSLPAALPATDAGVADWYQFEGVALSMARTAHQFTVLLPVGAGGAYDSAKEQERARLVFRVVGLEKPAHTAFQVKFYWAMFRVGEALLGQDTVVGLGSRTPGLLTPFHLDRSYLMESYLATPSGRPAPQERWILECESPG